MSKYAQRTDVSCDKSRAEIERTLQRYNASGFLYGWQEESAVVGFKMSGRAVRFVLPLPDKKADRFWKTPTRGTRRTETQAYEAWEQECRQRWRALALCIKAKLEAVESGITTFESEFLAHFVTSSGRTVGEVVIPQLEKHGEGQLSLGWSGKS